MASSSKNKSAAGKSAHNRARQTSATNKAAKATASERDRKLEAQNRVLKQLIAWIRQPSVYSGFLGYLTERAHTANATGNIGALNSSLEQISQFRGILQDIGMPEFQRATLQQQQEPLTIPLPVPAQQPQTQEQAPPLRAMNAAAGS